MTGFLKRIASALLVLILMAAVIPAAAVEAAPKKLAAPRITALGNETIKANQKRTPYKLKWSKVKGAARYQVYRASSVVANRPETQAEYKLVGTVKTNSFIDKKAGSFESYYYKVKAVSGSVSSTFRKFVNTRAIPEAPGSISVTTSKETRETAQLGWKAVRGAAGYRIMVSLRETAGYKTANVGRRTSANVKFLDTTPGREHFFTVRAYTKKNGVNYYSPAGYTCIIEPLKPPHVMDILKVNEEFGKLLNAERARVGRLPVVYEPRNQAYSTLRANELEVLWGHTRPCGCSGHDGICPHIDVHPGHRIMGENARGCDNYLAEVESDAEIARIIYTSWRNSPAHYEHMIRKRTSFSGIGSAGRPLSEEVEISPVFSVGVGKSGGAVFHLGVVDY